jgi:Icc-related predicted phosphoesterase
MAEDRLRIWFFTDIHGSTRCFRKFLNTPKNKNKPNVIVIGGDLTGKRVIPVVRRSDGTFRTVIKGTQYEFASNDLAGVVRHLTDCGDYPFECDLWSYKQFLFDEAYRAETTARLRRERLQEWVSLADAALPSPESCLAVVNLGNDDPFELDAVLDRSARMVRPEGKVVKLPAGFSLISTGYSNLTPWLCPRDESEKDLQQRIAKITGLLSALSLGKLVFNFHCPPFKTALDLAVKINPRTLQPYAGFKGTQREHVGSKAVREAIELWEPIASLHGHIHESTGKESIRNTVCFNPGTDYQVGVLRGVYLQINEAGHVEADVFTRDGDPENADGRTILEGILKSVPGGKIIADSGMLKAMEAPKVGGSNATPSPPNPVNVVVSATKEGTSE